MTKLLTNDNLRTWLLLGSALVSIIVFLVGLEFQVLAVKADTEAVEAKQTAIETMATDIAKIKTDIGWIKGALIKK